MADDKTIKRDETIRSVLLGLLVLAVALIVILSVRPLFIGDRSLVVPGAAIATDKLPDSFAGIVDEYGIHIRKLDRVPLLSALTAKTAAPAPPEDWSYDPDRPLNFGYSILERSAAAMPFWPRAEHGHVIYYETPSEFVVVPVTDDYLRQVKIPTAGPLDSGDYPLWPYMWGWLIVVAAAGIGVFELGAMRRRREALGMI